jgi:hypothetical protein
MNSIDLSTSINLRQKIKGLTASNPSDFERIALEVYEYQYNRIEIYQKFCDLLGRTPNNVHRIQDIPFLPISYFKSHQIYPNGASFEKIFETSGTTGENTGRHYVADLEWYNHIAKRGFSFFYEDQLPLEIFALLPGYLERNNSSLVHMVDFFMKEFNSGLGGFFMHDHQSLVDQIQVAKDQCRKVLLIGVSNALWDLAETFGPLDWQDVIIMETGGMKGKRKEIIRSTLHEILCQAFMTDSIHSEYGMTELLSQGYSKGQGVFYPIHTMKVIPYMITDPLTQERYGQQAVLHILDLANIDSCCFIATEDLGKVNADGSFEVLGRLDRSDVRGCNLLYMGA